MYRLPQTTDGLQRHSCDRSARRCLPGAILLAAASIALAGCGGGASATVPANSKQGAAKSPATPSSTGRTPAAETAAASVTNPTAVVARVGPTTLTAKALQHLVGLEVSTEAPPVRLALVPPSFAACVSQLQLKPAQQNTGTSSPSGLRVQCKKRFEETREVAERGWITGQWAIHGADELGMHVTPATVHDRYENYIRNNFKSFGEFARKLAEAGETEVDVLREMRVTTAQERMREAFERKGHAITSTDIAHYYDTHRLEFKVPRRRDVAIVRTKTKAAAVEIRRQIEAGKSFAEEASAAALRQPIEAKEGLVRDLKPGDYEEPSLESAIFDASRNVLSGPVRGSRGWYVFEVKASRPGRQKPFSEATPIIRRELPELREKRDSAEFTPRWEARWRKRTTCGPGYVVEKCREYMAVGASSAKGSTATS